MILGFSILNPRNNRTTNFVEKIITKTKLHTIRQGERWISGMNIHMATGMRTKYYKQFNKDRPDLQKCLSTQKIIIISSKKDIFIDGRRLPLVEQWKLIYFDGFDFVEDFWEWFDKDFTGQIIHWTKLKY